jgi:hypothetical protein
MKRFLSILLLLAFTVSANPFLPILSTQHAAGGSTLLTGLEAHYALDEASGTRSDSTANANHLSSVNTPTSNPGKISDAAQLTRTDGDYLNIADNASLSTGNINFSGVVWVYLDSKPAGIMTIAGKDGVTTTTREWLLYWDNTVDRFRFQSGRSGSTTVDTVTASNFGAPSLSTWYMIAFGHNATTGEVWISVNDGAVNTASRTTGPPDGNTPFRIGEIGNSLGLYWNGRIDLFSFYKKTLSASEITQHYNSGNGLAYGSF